MGETTSSMKSWMEKSSRLYSRVSLKPYVGCSTITFMLHSSFFSLPDCNGGSNTSAISEWG